MWDYMVGVMIGIMVWGCGWGYDRNNFMVNVFLFCWEGGGGSGRSKH